MPADIRQLKDRATEAYEKGKHKKAVELFAELCKAEPAEPGWPHRAGELWRKLGKSAEAVRYLVLAAELYARQGFLLKGVAVCKLVLSLEPAHAATIELLAGLLGKLAKQGAPRPSTGPAPARPAPAGPAAALETLAPEAAPPGAAAPEPEVAAQEVATAAMLENGAPLASLPLRRIVPGAHATREMPSLPVIEIPLDDDDDGISIGAVLEPTSAAAGSGAVASALQQLEPVVELPAARPVIPDLPRIPLFSSLKPQELRSLVERVQVMEVSDGEIVFAAGEPGDALYVVVRGAVKVLSGDGPGALVVDRLGEGAFFGEVSLISGTPHTATVVAESDATLMRVSRRVITELLAESPEVLRVLLGFFRSHLVNLLLASSPLFAPFAVEDRRNLAGRFRFIEIEPATTVITEGQLPAGLFIVLAGELRVSMRRGGVVVPLATLGGGDVCGEMSLLTHRPAMATIDAVTKCWALMLGRLEFAELIVTHPQVLAYISDLIDQRQRANEATLGGPRPHSEERVRVY
ncbi:MAG TPA: cyclic nucleotide-binding domain-containing protein [Polyangia bacterium]